MAPKSRATILSQWSFMKLSRHIAGAEAQAVGLDLGPEADTLVVACERQNLC